MVEVGRRKEEEVEKEKVSTSIPLSDITTSSSSGRLCRLITVKERW